VGMDGARPSRWRHGGHLPLAPMSNRIGIRKSTLRYVGELTKALPAQDFKTLNLYFIVVRGAPRMISSIGGRFQQ
jgi:hypothetical protein